MEGKLKIHSENILPILKRWLYTEKEIFLRELISNASDAIKKFQILQEVEKFDAQTTDFRIDVKINKDLRQLIISDNGIGMTAQEVETYIAQLAFSGAEEFTKKYASQTNDDPIIGHFGLGFYSSYMVSEKVEIQTKSYKEEEPVYWVCDGSSDYIIEKGTKERRGTDIILTLLKEEEEYLDHQRVKDLLTRYCAFLPIPIYLNDQLINSTPPLWVKTPAECTDKDYLDFYRQLYPGEEDPLFWVHLNVEYPFNVKSILYFPPISKEKQLKKDAIKLFCNRVFVTDQGKDLLPEYFSILKGALDSPDIPLNVSRSALQIDRTVRQLNAHISKKISDRLSSLYHSDRQKFIELWPDLEFILKYGCLHDDKFYERTKEFIIWKSTKNDWVTVEEYLEKNKLAHENQVFYAFDAQLKPSFLALYEAKGIDVLLISSSMADHAMLSFLEKKTSTKFSRVDSSIHESLLDKEKESTVLDSDGKTASSKLADLFKRKINVESLEVEAKSLASETIPGFLLQKEEQRRLKEMLSFQSGDVDSFAQFVKPTLVINTNHALIRSLPHLEEKDPELAAEVAQAVYENARLSQQEADAKTLQAYLTRTMKLLEKMSKGI